MKVRRAMLIVKETPFDRLQRTKKKSDKAMRQLLEQRHGSMVAFERAHHEHLGSLKRVREELIGRDITFEEQLNTPSKQITGVDLVISVGGDGTLLQASHGVRQKTPVLGVNSAPAYSVGFLTCCRAPTFARSLDDLIEDRVEPHVVQRLRVHIGRRALREPVLNDVLFCHDNPAVTTRYRLITPDGEEVQRSSGAWIATPAGSTAALRSAGGEAMPLEAKKFAYIIREPYAPPGSSVRLQGGELGESQKLAFESRVDTASVYLDGSHRRYTVPFGTVVTFSLHKQPLLLVRPR